jgi:hypothetical protein
MWRLVGTIALGTLLEHVAEEATSWCRVQLLEHLQLGGCIGILSNPCVKCLCKLAFGVPPHRRDLATNSIALLGQ